MQKAIGILSTIASLLLVALTLSAQDIQQAAGDGNLDKVQSLLDTNRKLINERNNEGDIPLCSAILNKHPDVALFLIRNGANIHNHNQDGLTPLHYAALVGDDITAKALLDKGADIDIATSGKETALHYAATRGHINVVTLLTEHGAALEAVNTYQRTPLLKAARERGGIATIKILVESGANINATDFFGDTPLSLAAWRGYEDIVDYLLEKGARYSASGESGIKLMSYAVDKRLLTLYHALLSEGGEQFLAELQQRPVLHWAAAGGSARIVDDLISREFQINARDAFQWTPLHYAAYFGRDEVAGRLIETGADINARTPLGETALYLARLEEENETAALLLTVGADPTTPGPTRLSGPYMGQEDPGRELKLFAPGIVSRLKGGHSNIVFSPDGSAAFWTEWVLTNVGYSAGGTVWHSKMKDGVWTFPEKFLSTGDTPFYSVDGKRIFLLATFPGSEDKEVKGIWYYDISGDDVFSGPNYLDFDVNSSGLYWQFSFDKHQDLYFSTDRGLFRSLFRNGVYSAIEDLSEIFNTDVNGGDPYISPDGDYLIFESSESEDSYGSLDLYICFKRPDGTWTRPVNMGHTVNSSALESLPIVSTDGKYLFLRTERNSVRGIYWTSAEIITELRRKVLN